MIRKYCLIFLVLLLGQSLAAQDNLVIQGASPDLYLLHTVSAKENWYSLGRMFNLSPKDLAAYNRISIDKPLEIGQQVKAPLTAANFSQNDVKAADEVFVPLYHVIKEKEWLYRVSVSHNKVPVEQLEKWNNIDKDQAKPGMRLIVGYLKVKQGNASLASATASQSSVPAVNTSVKTTVTKQEAPLKKAPDPVRNETPAVVQETKKIAPQTNAAAGGNQSASGNNGGYFKSQYEESGKTASGMAGVFKSASGWTDGKYYALMNNVPIGSIILINSPASNKQVYAKVLGELPDMKESAGLALRISDAAASELGATSPKFSVSVKY